MAQARLAAKAAVQEVPEAAPGFRLTRILPKRAKLPAPIRRIFSYYPSSALFSFL
jgi:hypothetical protein